MALRFPRIVAGAGSKKRSRSPPDDHSTRVNHASRRFMESCTYVPMGGPQTHRVTQDSTLQETTSSSVSWFPTTGVIVAFPPRFAACLPTLKAVHRRRRSMMHQVESSSARPAEGICVITRVDVDPVPLMAKQEDARSFSPRDADVNQGIVTTLTSVLPVARRFPVPRRNNAGYFADTPCEEGHAVDMTVTMPCLDVHAPRPARGGKNRSGVPPHRESLFLPPHALPRLFSSKMVHRQSCRVVLSDICRGQESPDALLLELRTSIATTPEPRGITVLSSVRAPLPQLPDSPSLSVDRDSPTPASSMWHSCLAVNTHDASVTGLITEPSLCRSLESLDSLFDDAVRGAGRTMDGISSQVVSQGDDDSGDTPDASTAAESSLLLSPVLTGLWALVEHTTVLSRFETTA